MEYVNIPLDGVSFLLKLPAHFVVPVSEAASTLDAIRHFLRVEDGPEPAVAIYTDEDLARRAAEDESSRSGSDMTAVTCSTRLNLAKAVIGMMMKGENYVSVDPGVSHVRRIPVGVLSGALIQEP
jgi:hypothetical protein